MSFVCINISSLLGMVLFGCTFCNRLSNGEERCSVAEVWRQKYSPDPVEACECDRTNFDTLLNAWTTVFQVYFLFLSWSYL